MSYTSFYYYVMILLLLPIYYLVPLKHRWIVLLCGSSCFISQIMTNRFQIMIFVSSVLFGYLFGILLHKYSKIRASLKMVLLICGITASVLPLLFVKISDYFAPSTYINRLSFVIPVGLSFYSLQLIAYLIDIYECRIIPQTNPFKFALFISFFPQIIQGPIPRYAQLCDDLFNGNKYEPDNIVKGIQLIIWGFFLKFMIADKTAVIVNEVFDNYQAYAGIYVWFAAFLYSIQLYTDFLSCTTLAQGVAQLFGVNVTDNFNHPYFSKSIKEFWHRWHISLSTWLRDYIYIPLGGNRHGKSFKWLNISITFLLSGIWHGNGYSFLVWGLLHACYQILEDGRQLCIKKSKSGSSAFQLSKTFLLVMFGWIIFRAPTLKAAAELIKNMFSVFNPWILFDGSLFRLGLDHKEFFILVLSLMILLTVSFYQEKGIRIRDWILSQNIAVRWGIMLLAIWSIWIFGTYGYGFDVHNFIYGGF